MKSSKMNEFKNYIKKIERILIRKRKYCQKTLLLRKNQRKYGIHVQEIQTEKNTRKKRKKLNSQRGTNLSIEKGATKLKMINYRDKRIFY